MTTSLMADFNAFEVRAWHEDGLTIRWTPERKRSTRAPRASVWATGVIVSLVALGVTMLAPVLSAAQSSFQLNPPSLRSRAAQGSGASDEVLPSYWPRLIASMGKWRVLEESSLPDLDPGF